MYSTNELRKEVHNAAKAINGSVQNAKAKKLAIKRLHRLHRANRPQVKGVKKEEPKKWDLGDYSKVKWSIVNNGLFY